MVGPLAAIVALPPLFAEMVGSVLERRAGVARVVTIPASPDLSDRLRAAAPNLVITCGGGRARRSRIATIAAAVPAATIVVLSADGRYILSPGNRRELTQDALVDLVRQQTGEKI